MEAMNLQAADLTALNQLNVMQSVLQNMATNIALIESGTIGQVISVTNSNLFAIAAQQYGDATQWTVIAEANGLTDPMIEATITITLPIETPNQMVLSGIPASPQIISFTINDVNYVYNVTSTDTLNSIVTNISIIVPNAVPIGNILFLPIGTVILNIDVLRVVNLVIPQQSGIPSGGILSD